MRIAHIVSTQFTLPPKKHNGRLFLASDLIEEQIKNGHKVTLFAHHTARSSAKLVSLKDPIKASGSAKQKLATHRTNNLALFSVLYQQAGSFDVIHSHLDSLAAFFAPFVNTPTIATMHAPLFDATQNMLKNLPKKNLYFAPISNAQKQIKNPGVVNFTSTVYNGIRVDQIKASPKHGKYLAYVGRIVKEKGIETACQVAKQTKTPLKIAGRVKAKDKEYFESVIKPYIDGKLISYVGEIPRRSVFPFLRDALAFIFPLQWPEPFGLVNVESLAVGTPVLSFDVPPVNEIVEHGVSGFLARNQAEMVQFVNRIQVLDRHECRKRAEEFSVEAMAQNYEKVYTTIIKKSHP